MPVEKQLSDEIYKELFSVNYELQSMVNTIYEKGGYPNNKRNRIASAFLAKSIKTNYAIVKLCKYGYGEDAVILARSIFDILVDLLYMLRFKRDTMLDRYELWDYVIRAKMLNVEGKTRNQKKLIREREKNPKPGDESYVEINRHAQKAKKRFKYRSDTWRPHQLNIMAGKVGMGHAYKTMFKLHSQVVHTAPRIINNYAVVSGNDIHYSSAPSHLYLEDALIAGFWLSAQVLKKFSELTNVIKRDDIVMLEAKHALAVGKVLKAW